MPTKILLKCTILVFATSMFFIGCQSNNDSSNESEDKCHISDSTETYAAIQRIDPNAKLIAKFEKTTTYEVMKNLEFWFDKIHYKDTINEYIFTYYKDGEPIENYIWVWSDGIQTVFHLVCGPYEYDRLILVYEGDVLKKKYIFHQYVDYLNDIDEDGVPELIVHIIIDPSPAYVDHDEREYYLGKGQMKVYKCTTESIYLDNALSKEVTDYMYEPIVYDTTWHLDSFTIYDAPWGRDTFERHYGDWADTTTTLYEYKYNNDLNKYSLYELGLRKRGENKK